MISLQTTDSDAGCRLDRILRKRLALMSLSAIYAMIRRGGVLANGKKVRQDYRIAAGDVLSIDADPAELTAPANKDAAGLIRLVKTDFFKRNFSVLYEDGDVLACDKPAGLAVHPGTGHLRHDTLLDCALAWCLQKQTVRDSSELALAHRLDRDTSGVILLAKNKRALRRLHESFRGSVIDKSYIAVCHHRPPEVAGEIALRLERGRDGRGETVMRVSRSGVLSRSRYRIDAFENGLSRVEVGIDTGKTHQIRVHLAHLGAPLVGDVRYGDSRLDEALFSRRTHLARRLYLHAGRIEVPHPATGRMLVITAPLPPEFTAIMA